jgi:eukaryotic-like serine/threonine-protein kinase
VNTVFFSSDEGGRLIANRYQLKILIASGGMGEVFLAQDILLGGVPVAIKLIYHGITDSKEHQEFADEARICATLSQRSIHIVKVTDYGVSDTGEAFYVMEYLEGKTLGDLIPLPVDRFVKIARQICLGLQCAHEGINIDGKNYPLVHRDIKPANILVTSDLILGELVKILDFGVAKVLNFSSSITNNNPNSSSSNNNSFQGTLPYCSPEQLEGGEIDRRSDIYSLGVVMYETLTGNKPWQPETDYFGAWYKSHRFEMPRPILSGNSNLEIPKVLQDLIMTCLLKNPADRPQNLAEVIKGIENIKTQHLEVRFTEKLSSCFKSIIIPSTTRASSNSTLSLSVEEACWQLTWSKDKPIQEIVFPQLVTTESETVAVLSLMMSKQEIQKRGLTARYNQFIFIGKPYPMLLWVTLLYSRLRVASPLENPNTKWLPCYLDMQNQHHLNIIRSLSENDTYPLIFFSLQPPHTCINVLESRIDSRQQQKLKLWLQQINLLPTASSFHMDVSKKLLHQHYQQMRSRKVACL